MNRIIIHIDMNAFFASVEQAARPSLQGRPVAVTGSGSRTVIVTASYEARAFGVKTGTLVPEARRLCPHIILVQADNSRYTHVSRSLCEYLEKVTPLVEAFSIDEYFLDVTKQSEGSYERAAGIVRGIKEWLRNSFSPSCSAGIAPNKAFAKLASDMQKPDGLTIITKKDLPGILVKTPVKELCGIGGSTAASLEALGITTCADLGAASPQALRRRFGIVGERLSLLGKGLDPDPVRPEPPFPKSCGHSLTFEEDTSEMEVLNAYLQMLSWEVSHRLLKQDMEGCGLTLAVRYRDFSSSCPARTFKDTFFSGHNDIYVFSRDMLAGLCLRLPVRLLGVTVFGLRPSSGQASLFEDGRDKRLDSAIEAIQKSGLDISPASSLILPSRKGPGISPAWRPRGIRSV